MFLRRVIAATITTPNPKLPHPTFTVILKRCCVIFTGQEDRKDFSKGLVGLHGVVQPHARILYTHEGRPDCCAKADDP